MFGGRTKRERLREKTRARIRNFFRSSQIEGEGINTETNKNALHNMTSDKLGEAVSMAIQAHSKMHSSVEPEPISVSPGVDPLVSLAQDIGDVAIPLFKHLKNFLPLVDALSEIHPYAKMATAIFTAIPKIFLVQMQRDTAIRSLLDSIVDIYALVEKYNGADLDRQRRKLLRDLALQTVECAYFIRDQTSVRSYYERAAKSVIKGANIDAQVEEYTNAFVNLRRRLTEEGVLETEFRVLKSLSTINDNIELLALSLIRGAGLNSAKVCLPGTRIRILDELSTWVNDAEGARVRFLLGLAGTGKSAIAHSLGAQFDALRRLGCFFAFSRDFQGDRHPESIIPTIAHRLASWNPDFKRSLARTLSERGALADTTDIPTQWVELIVEPASRVTFVGPVLIIIDAFDESSAGSNSARRLLLQCLTVDAQSLPSNFRILVTSRPEHDVTSALADLNHNHSVQALHLDHGSIDTNSDVEAYVRHVLQVERSYQHGLDDSRIRAIVECAKGLFQWAFLACRVIQDNPAGRSLQERFDSRFQSIIQCSSSLDQLYAEMLQQIFPVDDEEVMTRFRSVMGQIMCTSEPMSASTLQRIRSSASGDTDNDISLIVPYMGAFLSGLSGQEPIRPLHTSFRDFLLDSTKSGVWHTNLHDGHLLMSQGLLAVLDCSLRFNICDIKTSYAPNPEVIELPQDVRVPELVYAASYLKDHIPSPCANPSAASNERLITSLHIVLCDKLLFWLELLSVLQRANTAITVLHKVLALFSSLGDIRGMESVRDAVAFVQRFRQVISLSAPHIYISALSFAPTASLTKRVFSPAFPRIPRISSTSSHWPPMLAAFPVNTQVYTVAWSNNGRYIACGSRAYTIQLWSVNSGQLVHEPLTGHSNRVNTIAFSPDSQRIVSGSSDSTLRIWDITTGKVVGSPLRGHTGQVRAVAYFPDGHRIVSGSFDTTVRVWDATTGGTIGEPFCGHAESVLSVACSPDGHHIVSSSYDGTARIWDAATGQTVHTLLGHCGPVWSIIYSFDGREICSGSDDATIRIWDSKSGEAIGEPLRDHASPVWAVAYSPDGDRIISGLNDSTICIWDTGLNRLAPTQVLRGHSEPVYSVACAPDGQQILSCSADGTVRIWSAVTEHTNDEQLSHTGSSINGVAFSHDGGIIIGASTDATLCVWDAASGKTIQDPLRGHADLVYSVACSLDGSRIASCSRDKTVRIWDAKTGKAIGDPLRGHERPVYAVAFRPDGRHIASASQDGTIRIWDSITGDAVGEPLRGHIDGINSIAYSPDGYYIVSGSRDVTIRVWDAETGNAIGLSIYGHYGSVRSVIYSPDGRSIISGSSDTTVRIWSAATHEPFGEPLRGHSKAVTSVACSPNGRILASASHDWTICLWDFSSGTAIGKFIHGHSNTIWTISFSPDSRFLVSASGDGTARVWDVDSAVSSSADVEASSSSDETLPNTTVSPRAHSEYQNSGKSIVLGGGDSSEMSSIAVPSVQGAANRKLSLSFDYSQEFAFNSPPAPWLHCHWEDGWIVDAAGNLLIWVPDEYRNSLSWPGTHAICGGREQRVTVDFSGAMYGPEWMKCVDK